MYKPVNTHFELQQEWRNQFVQWYAAGMPAFTQPIVEPYKRLHVNFKTKEDRIHFGEKFGYKLTEKTPYIHFPDRPREVKQTSKWEDDIYSETRYPIYIISKGRWESRHTSKALERLEIPYYIVVEPQEYDMYCQHIDSAKVLTLPFSNHGKGSGPARNWCWEHSIANGHARHWLMDDNIANFGRLHNNKLYVIPIHNSMLAIPMDNKTVKGMGEVD